MLSVSILTIISLSYSGVDADNVTQHQHWAAQHKHHATKLEQVLRKLENNEISPLSRLDELNEHIDYYLMAYQEPEFYFDDEIYSEFGLEDAAERKPY